MMRSSLAALFGGALLFTGAAVAPAQSSVVTEPVGFTTLTAAARPSSANRSFTYVALNMFRPTAFRGVVTSTAGTTLTFPANSFTADQFTRAASGALADSFTNAHFVEITNGTSAGILVDVISNTTNTLTLSEDVSAFITGGTTAIRIRPHWTFATALPVAAFRAGTFANADTVSIINPAGTLVNYYVRSANSTWTNGPTQAASNVLIRPDTGLLVERVFVDPAGISFTLTGEVKLGPTEIAVYGAAAGTTRTTIVPNPYPLASVQLSASGLFTNAVATGLVGGGSSAAADNLIVFPSGGGSPTTYYFRTVAPNANQIVKGVSTLAGTETLPEGSSFLIVRKGGRGDFAWVVPAPSMTL